MNKPVAAIKNLLETEELNENVRQTLELVVDGLEGNFLGEYLVYQRQLMDILDIESTPVQNWHTSALLKDMLVCLAGEAHEAIDPINTSTKPWKSVREESAIKDEVEKEVIDIFFFYLEVMLIMGIDGKKLHSLYMSKFNKNMKRAGGTVHLLQGIRFGEDG